MAIVYRYIDKNDNIIKYVGIVYGKTRTLDQRISEHKLNKWYQNGNWEIEYLQIDSDSRTDAEYLESHFIALYGTYKYYNKAKAHWGVSCYIPDMEDKWEKYDKSLDLPSVKEIASQLLSYKTDEERASYQKKIISKLGHIKNQHRYGYKYKDIKNKFWDEVNSYINVLIYGSDIRNASIQYNGEIQIKIGYIRAIYSPVDHKVIVDGRTMAFDEAQKYLAKREHSRYKEAVDAIMSSIKPK